MTVSRFDSNSWLLFAGPGLRFPAALTAPDVSVCHRAHFRELAAQMSMSALGHKQTFAVRSRMSALPPRADMCSAVPDVRFGPIADIAGFHSITSSARKQRGRHGDAECLGGLEIDHQLILGRSLDRKVSRLHP